MDQFKKFMKKVLHP